MEEGDDSHNGRKNTRAGSEVTWNQRSDSTTKKKEKGRHDKHERTDRCKLNITKES